jgi:hypothetical protein
MIGFHSVMDNPDPVKRVAPPMITITQTASAMKSSQYPTPGPGKILRGDVISKTLSSLEKATLPCQLIVSWETDSRTAKTPEERLIF